jgi:hypothetical protein
VNGETRNDVELALETARPGLLGLPLEPVRETALGAAELFTAPSARCAFETALFDAFAKHRRTSLFEFFGAREARLTTDITLTTGDALQAAAQATSAAGRGFRTLKIKIGGATLEHDRERILAAGARRARSDSRARRKRELRCRRSARNCSIRSAPCGSASPCSSSRSEPMTSKGSAGCARRACASPRTKA